MLTKIQAIKLKYNWESVDKTEKQFFPSKQFFPPNLTPGVS